MGVNGRHGAAKRLIGDAWRQPIKGGLGMQGEVRGSGWPVRIQPEDENLKEDQGALPVRGGLGKKRRQERRKSSKSRGGRNRPGREGRNSARVRGGVRVKRPGGLIEGR